MHKAIESWRLAAHAAARASEAYRSAWAKAFVVSCEKTEAAKKASADIATSDLRIHRNEAEIERDAALHVMLFLRGDSSAQKSEAA